MSRTGAQGRGCEHRRVTSMLERPAQTPGQRRGRADVVATLPVAGVTAALWAAGVPRAGLSLAVDEALQRVQLEARADARRHGAHLRQAAKQMTIDLLALTEPPTAIVAASDIQAVGVIEGAETQGLRVPHDLSVVGYDDIALSRWMSPQLTTVHQPLRRMGEPDDIGGVAVFLASPAGRYVTGQTVVADGGMMIR